MTFEVLIDDNAHYQDETERRKQGEYDSYEEALAAAKSIVDGFLLQHRAQYQKASMLFNVYCQYGEDPFILPDDQQERFSARDYARQRCQQLFDEPDVDN